MRFLWWDTVLISRICQIQVLIFLFIWIRFLSLLSILDHPLVQDTLKTGRVSISTEGIEVEGSAVHLSLISTHICLEANLKGQGYRFE